jgi:hypothetical protein
MKMKLVVVFTVLFFATLARADSFTDANGTIFYPDGSTITYYLYHPSTAENGYSGSSVIGFEFADGNGSAFNLLPVQDQQSGGITFNSPVTDLSVAWTGEIYINFVGPNGEIGNDMNFVPGPVSSISWDTDGTYSGSAGIDSMSYTVPEPKSLLLLSFGLFGLVALSLKKAASGWLTLTSTMKVKLAVAFAALFFATIARADSLTDTNGTIYYPNGSTITSYVTVPADIANDFTGETVIDFTFSGGNGVDYNYETSEGEQSGGIWFNSPFSDLEVTWAGTICLDFVGTSGDLGGVCGGGIDKASPGNSFFVVGPVISISWDTFDPYDGYAGITSLTVPEPSSLLLSGIGLAALLCLFAKFKIQAANN